MRLSDLWNRVFRKSTAIIPVETAAAIEPVVVVEPVAVNRNAPVVDRQVGLPKRGAKLDISEHGFAMESHYGLDRSEVIVIRDADGKRLWEWVGKPWSREQHPDNMLFRGTRLDGTTSVVWDDQKPNDETPRIRPSTGSPVVHVEIKRADIPMTTKVVLAELKVWDAQR